MQIDNLGGLQINITAPPMATTSPAAWKPVSRATAAPAALLLLVVKLEVVGVAFTPAEELLEEACVVTGHAVVHGILLVKTRFVAIVADAKTGAWEAI